MTDQHLVVPLDQIIVAEDRYRKKFNEDKILELAQSIEEATLINLPVCRRARDGEGWEMVAGERRLRAIKHLALQQKVIRYGRSTIKPGFIPIRNIDDLTELEAREIEFAENAIRLDLDWRENVAAIAALHELRKRENPSHTMVDTHKEVYGDDAPNTHKTVSQAISLAQNLSRPEVARAQNPTEAYRNLMKERERFFQSTLMGMRSTAGSEHEFHEGDCIEVMKGFNKETFDVICTDPPYGISSHIFKSPRAASHHYDDSREMWIGLMGKFAVEALRVTKPEAHLYCFCDMRNFATLAQIVYEVGGWKVWPRPIVWSKGQGLIPDGLHGPQYTYEILLFANKGQKRVTGLYPDVIAVPGVNTQRGDTRYHAAQKPAEVIANLLRRSCFGGWTERVLDPFAGSGTIFEAATARQVRATAIELDPENANVCRGRMTPDEQSK